MNRLAGTFTGKRMLITGASKGLGAVAALHFATLGARLVLIARHGEKLEEVRSRCQNSEQHLCLAADLTVGSERMEAITKAQEFFGEGGDIEVVLHVAGGGLGLRDPLLSADNFEKLIGLNLKQVLEINRLVVPAMIERKQGNLVQVCSIASSEATGSVGYNTAKAALAAYVRTLGRELAPYNIIATGILPGGFIAPENSWVRFQQRDPEGVQKFIAERLPRGKLGTAEELLPLLTFLCSDQASMMGGCLVPIDAGEGKAYNAE